jgi:Sulfotransferase family
MRAYNAHQFIPFKWAGRNWAKRMGWSRDELDARLARFYDEIFMRNVERQGKRRWGDKTPFHTWHIDAMARLFPDAVFVAIVRHPGGNVASNMNRFGHTFARAVSHVDRYGRELARQAARHRERFALVRYEELVLRSEPVLRELLEWLGEPWSEQVLEHHTVQLARGGNLTVEGRSRRDDPIDSSRVDKWRRTITDDRRVRLAERLGRLGAFYGYSIDDATALAPLRDDGALLVRGADLEARIDRFADLELRKRPEVPIYDRLYHPGKVQMHTRRTDGRFGSPPPEPRAIVRAWRVLPPATRRRLYPLARRVREKIAP